MKRVTILFFAFLSLMGCDQRNDATSGYSNDEIAQAALSILRGRIPYVYPSYLGGSLQSCDEAQKSIDKARKDFTDYQPSRMRKEIMRWLDYYQRDLNEKKYDIKNQISKKELDEYRAKNDILFNNAKDLVQKLNKDQP